MEYNLFYDWKHHLQPLGRGGTVKIFSQTMIDLMTEVFVEQPLVSPGFAYYILSTLGLDSGYTVKYSPSPFRVSSAIALGNFFWQKGDILSCIPHCVIIRIQLTTCMGMCNKFLLIHKGYTIQENFPCLYKKKTLLSS